jgi:hypothetical protein
MAGAATKTPMRIVVQGTPQLLETFAGPGDWGAEGADGVDSDGVAALKNISATAVASVTGNAPGVDLWALTSSGRAAVVDTAAVGVEVSAAYHLDFPVFGKRQLSEVAQMCPVTALWGVSGDKSLVGHAVDDERLIAESAHGQSPNVVTFAMAAVGRAVVDGAQEVATPWHPMTSAPVQSVATQTRANMAVVLQKPAVLALAAAGFRTLPALLASPDLVGPEFVSSLEGLGFDLPGLRGLGALQPPEMEEWLLRSAVFVRDWDDLGALQPSAQQLGYTAAAWPRLPGGVPAWAALGAPQRAAVASLGMSEAAWSQHAQGRSAVVLRDAAELLAVLVQYHIEMDRLVQAQYNEAAFAGVLANMVESGKVPYEGEAKQLVEHYLDPAARRPALTPGVAESDISVPVMPCAEGQADVAAAMAPSHTSEGPLPMEVMQMLVAAAARSSRMAPEVKALGPQGLARRYVAAVARQRALNEAICAAVDARAQLPAGDPGRIEPSVANDYGALGALEPVLAGLNTLYDTEYLAFVGLTVDCYNNNAMNYASDTTVMTPQEVLAAPAGELNFAHGSTVAVMCEQPVPVPASLGSPHLSGDCENCAAQIGANAAKVMWTAYAAARPAGLSAADLHLAPPIPTSTNLRAQLFNAVQEVTQSLSIGTCLCSVNGAQISDAQGHEAPVDPSAPPGLHMIGVALPIGVAFGAVRRGKEAAGSCFKDAAFNAPNAGPAAAPEDLAAATQYDLPLAAFGRQVKADIIRNWYNGKHLPEAVPGMLVAEGTGPADLSAFNLECLTCDSLGGGGAPPEKLRQRRVAAQAAVDEHQIVSAGVRAALGMDPSPAYHSNPFLPACGTNASPVQPLTHATVAAGRAAGGAVATTPFYRRLISAHFPSFTPSVIASRTTPAELAASGVSAAMVKALFSTDGSFALSEIPTFDVCTMSGDGRLERTATMEACADPLHPAALVLAPGPKKGPEHRHIARWAHTRAACGVTRRTPRSAASVASQVRASEFYTDVLGLAGGSTAAASALAAAADGPAWRVYTVNAASASDARSRVLIVAELREMLGRSAAGAEIAVTNVQTIPAMPGSSHSTGFTFAVVAAAAVLADAPALKLSLELVSALALETRATDVRTALARPSVLVGAAGARRALGAARRAQALASAGPQLLLEDGVVGAALDSLDMRAAFVCHYHTRGALAEAAMAGWVAGAALSEAGGGVVEMAINGVTFMSTETARTMLHCFRAADASYCEAGVTTHELAEQCGVHHIEVDDMAVTALLFDAASEDYVKLFDEVGENRVALTVHALRLLEACPRCVPLEAVW